MTFSEYSKPENWGDHKTVSPDGLAMADKIIEWAKENYANSYGASCLIECYSRAELACEFDSLKDAKEFALLKDEQNENYRYE